MKKFFVLMILFLSSSAVFAASWVQIGPKEYIDKDTVSRYRADYNNAAIVSFWLKCLNDKSKRIKSMENDLKSKIWFEKFNYEINCSSKQIRSINYVVYGLEGDVLDSDRQKDSWNDIVPDTNGAIYYEIFCKG